MLCAGRALAQDSDLARANALDQQVLQLYHQGRYGDAVPVAKEALAIRERALGSKHPDVAANLNNLAALYNSQGRYAVAEPLYQSSLAIREKALGGEHPDVARSLDNLAAPYRQQRRIADALELSGQAVNIPGQTLYRWPELLRHWRGGAAQQPRLHAAKHRLGFHRRPAGSRERKLRGWPARRSVERRGGGRGADG